MRGGEDRQWGKGRGEDMRGGDGGLGDGGGEAEGGSEVGEGDGSGGEDEGFSGIISDTQVRGTERGCRPWLFAVTQCVFQGVGLHTR